jgi:hypothetical protein
MKIHLISIHPRFSVAIALLVCFGLSTPTLHAQTFTGQAKLNELPDPGFQALVCPVATKPSTISINFDNKARGSVRVQIRDQWEKIVYDEFESSVYYRQYFDLSSMPAGIYTVSLSKPYAVYTQTFRIEPPTPGRVVAVSEPSATETLIVKQ